MAVEQAQLKVGQVVLIKSEVIREIFHEYLSMDFYFAEVLRLDSDHINLYRIFISESHITGYLKLEDIHSLVDGYSSKKT